MSGMGRVLPFTSDGIRSRQQTLAHAFTWTFERWLRPDNGPLPMDHVVRLVDVPMQPTLVAYSAPELFGKVGVRGVVGTLGREPRMNSGNHVRVVACVCEARSGG